MERGNAWENSLNNNFSYFKSKKELIDYIRFNDIHYFLIDNKNNTEPISNFSYIDISKTLYINEVFYRENKHELDEYIKQNLIFAVNIMMSKHIYSEDLIRKLICAETIVFEQEIEISKEIIELLKYKGVKFFIKDGDDIVSTSLDEMVRTHK